MKRKQLTPATRRLIYEKFDGCCAYCGKELEWKEMQVDHIMPLRKGGSDTRDNMFPSCRRCNHYKSTLTVEQFREAISLIPQKLMRDNYIFKVGCDYGFWDEQPKKVVFYFEWLKQNENNK